LTPDGVKGGVTRKIKTQGKQASDEVMRKVQTREQSPNGQLFIWKLGFVGDCGQEKKGKGASNKRMFEGPEGKEGGRVAKKKEKGGTGRAAPTEGIKETASSGERGDCRNPRQAGTFIGDQKKKKKHEPCRTVLRKKKSQGQGRTETVTKVKGKTKNAKPRTVLNDGNRDKKTHRGGTTRRGRGWMTARIKPRPPAPTCSREKRLLRATTTL